MKKNPYNVQSISFSSEDLLVKAKQRAASFRISLSNYICQLVQNDLDDAHDVVIRARPESAVAHFAANDRPANSAPPSADAVDSYAKSIGKHRRKKTPPPK